MNTVADSILNLIYPPKCSFCGNIIDKIYNGVCDNCRRILPFISDGEIKLILPGGFNCYSVCYYDELIRKSFLNYKFGGHPSYGRSYAMLMAEILKNQVIDIDLITWIPLSRKKYRQRGYDQAKILAVGVAEIFGIDCRQILYKNRNTGTQSLVDSAEERFINIAGAYSVLHTESVDSLSILVIDDLVTTGATLSEACKVIKQAGAKSVEAASFARAKLK